MILADHLASNVSEKYKLTNRRPVKSEHDASDEENVAKTEESVEYM